MASNYSTIERGIAKVLNSFPEVKLLVKKQYQRFNYLFFRKKYRFKCDRELNYLPIEGETFFGYYDHSPESENQRFILFYLSDNHPTVLLPNPDKPIYVGVFDKTANKVIYKKRTYAYNWQQGSRLQWLDGSHFIYNQYDTSNGYCSVIVNVNKIDNIEEIFPLPIYDCYKKKFAVTLNFNRLNKLRPDYGYRNQPNEKLPSYDQDGIFYLDLKSGDYRLLISIERLCKFHQKEEMDFANHKVNHIMISPSGKNFIFLHRYFYKGKRIDRLILSNITGDKLDVLADNEMVSHCYWMNDREIVAYLRDITWGDKYYKINIENREKILLGKGIIDRFGDGHPVVKNDKMVFDTYPDKSRMKGLFCFNFQNSQLYKLGEFFESINYYAETRCDLHPRFNFSGERLYFDSVHNGKRCLYWISMK